MASEKTEILTGAAVLVVALAFAAYVARGSGFAPSGESYALKASFRSVEGVTVGTDVRLAGVKIGTVTSLKLNPQTYFADATISVAKDVILPDDSTILISSEGLLGGSFVELQPGGSPTNLAPGAEIEDTQGAVSVINLLMKFVGGDKAGTPAAPAGTAGTAP